MPPVFRPLEIVDLDRTCEFDGVREMAAPNTHAVALHLVTAAKDARVADLPCGAGAMTARLRAHGFSNVICADIDAASLQISGVPFVRVDLRERLPFDDGAFESVLCIECIEHLENPFQLMRELERILAPGGELIISTPNVLSTNARSKYFSVGYLPHFDDLACRWERQRALGFQAHIMPVPFHWLMYMAQLNALELEEVAANRYARRPKLKDRLIAKLVRAAGRRFFRPDLYSVLTHDVLLYGDILIARFRKQASHASATAATA